MTLLELRLANLSCTDTPGTGGSKNLSATLSFLPQLRLLELSGNRLGKEGGMELATALESHGHLRTLLLQGVSVPDRTLATILGSALTVPCLTDLDISKNDIGLEVPSLAANALATLIQSSSGKRAPLQRLNAGWNALRSPSAEVTERFNSAELVAKSLASNSYLVSLELGWNGLSDGGAMWLAESIRECAYLQYVGLANNSIGEKGCYVLADCLKENNGLKFMKLDGNPIGKHGIRAVLRAIDTICTFGWAKRVSFAACNITITAPPDLNHNHDLTDPSNDHDFLDRQRPGGVWVCDLSKPFHRATAWELVNLAWTQPGQNWQEETLDGKPWNLDEPGPGEVWSREDYNLPTSGILKVKYVATPRVPRLSDVVTQEMAHRILRHMSYNSATVRHLPASSAFALPCPHPMLTPVPSLCSMLTSVLCSSVPRPVPLGIAPASLRWCALAPVCAPHTVTTASPDTRPGRGLRRRRTRF